MFVRLFSGNCLGFGYHDNQGIYEKLCATYVRSLSYGARLAERSPIKALRQRQSSYPINLDALAACLASAIVW